MRAIELSPDGSPPYLGLGQTFFFQSQPDFQRAIESFQRAVELSPEWAEAHYWLGLAQEKAGALRDAIASLEKAIQLNPSDPRPVISLGVCLTRLKDYARAVASLRQGISMNPHYGKASAHLFLADALNAAGRLGEACEEWRKVLQMPSEYPDYDGPKKEAKECLDKYERGTSGRK
jgi:tetratricopeptide (TPR) repeat protein